jgi:hypothetical protein
LSNGAQKLLICHWLREEGIADAKKFFFAIAGYDNDGNVTRGRLTFQHQNDFFTAHTGHAHVTNNSAWNNLADQSEAIVAGERDANFIATRLQKSREDFCHIRIIIDDYHELSHLNNIASAGRSLEWSSAVWEAKVTEICASKKAE